MMLNLLLSWKKLFYTVYYQVALVDGGSSKSILFSLVKYCEVLVKYCINLPLCDSNNYTNYMSALGEKCTLR